MVSVRHVVITTGVCLGALVLGPVSLQAQAPPSPAPNLALTARLALEAEGAVRFRVPAWKKARHESAVALLERGVAAGEEATLHMLLLAIEPGPEGSTSVDWESIRRHIVAGVGEGASSFDLTLAGPWNGLPGFRAQRMRGQLSMRGQRIEVHLLALVASGRLVTVTVLGEPEDVTSSPLMESVARTVELGR